MTDGLPRRKKSGVRHDVTTAIQRDAVRRGAISVEPVHLLSGFPCGNLERYNGGVWKAMVVGSLFEFDNPGTARAFLTAAGELMEAQQTQLETDLRRTYRTFQEAQ